MEGERNKGGETLIEGGRKKRTNTRTKREWGITGELEIRVRREWR